MLLLVLQLAQRGKQLQLKAQVETLISSAKLVREPLFLIRILQPVYLHVLLVNYLPQKVPIQIPINNVELAQEAQPF